MFTLISTMRYFFYILTLTVFLAPSLQAQEATVNVGIADISGRPGDRVIIPVEISGLAGREIVSGEVKLTFDSAVLTYLETVRRGGLIENQRWLTADQLIADDPAANIFQIVYAAASGFSRNGELVFMAFQISETAIIGTTTTLTVTEASFNNGTPLAVLGSGTLSVVSQVVQANFVGRPRRGQVPFEVEFNENSVGEITSYAWDFGDGGTSSQRNPTHNYTVPGTYTVSLTVSGAEGSDTETKVDYIEAQADTTAPEIISGPRAVSIQRTSARIQWVTNELSNSFVEYSTREDFPNSETVTLAELTKNHKVDLENLDPDTRYFYRVSSTDAAGNTSRFKRGFFHTKGRADTRPPVIVKGPIADEVSDASAIIVWLTNEVSNSIVDYATRDDLSNPTRIEIDESVEEHRVELTGLEADTRYFFRIRSVDAVGNESNYKRGSFKTEPGPDTEPPVIILGPVAIGRTHQSATIKWITNEPATALVNYGAGTDYGTSESRDTRRKVHLIRLTNLEPSTLYHYQVVSTDAAGNVHTSGDFEFITRGERDERRPKIVLRPYVIGRFLNRLIVRFETDEPCNVVVEYGADENYGNIALGDGEGREHTIVLTDLDPDTDYHFRASVTDQSGNGPVFSDNHRGRTPNREEAELRILEGPIVADRGAERATIRWKTSRLADSFIAYGPDANYGSEQGSADLSVDHEIVISGLAAATLYHYQVSSTDPAESAVSSADRTLTTRAAADTLTPLITRGPEVAGLTDSSAFIAWNTDEPSNALVEYGPDLNYGETVFQEDFVPEHRVSLTGLTPGQTYHFRVSSTDQAGNGPVTSGDLAFTTLEVRDVKKPAIIAGPGVRELKSDQATLVWRTDEPSSSFVDYGADTGYGNRSGDSALTRRHEVTITGLEPGGQYHYQVVSTDAAGNTSESGPAGNDSWSADLTFRTPEAADTEAPIITRGPVIISSNKGALITFTTNERSIARLAYGSRQTLDTASEEVVYETEATTDHRIRIGHLSARTRYLFRLTCRDGAGNVLEIGPPRRRGKIVPVAGADDLFGALEFTTEETADELSPVIISGPTLVSRGADSAIIEWQTDEPADSFIDYGTSALNQTIGDAEYVQEHRVVLTGLDFGTSYSYQVRSTDFAGNAPVASEVVSFTTLTEADLVPPTFLGDPQLTYVDDSQAILEWNSDEAASPEVVYGAGETLDQIFFSEEFTTAHSVHLTGLATGTTYNYQIELTDPSGNGPTTSAVLSFATAAAADVAAPILSDIVVAQNDISAIVTWTTDEQASGFVYFGADSLDQAAAETEFSTEHQVVLTNLVAGATYSFQVQSIDPIGNSSERSAVSTFVTSTGPDVAAPDALAGFDAVVGLESAILSWPAVTATDLAGYTLYRKVGIGEFAAVATGLADTFYVDSGLLFGGTYTYYATAIDRNGNESAASVEAGGSPSIRNVPGAVSPIGAEIAGTQVTLQVANATSASGGGALTYTFHVSTSELFDDIVARATGVEPGSPTTSWSFSKELEAGREYFWRARASDETFDGPWGFPSFFSAPGSSGNQGDFNGDGIVSFDDFFLFADKFGIGVGEAGYDVLYDMDSSDRVDFGDFFIFADVFGTTYSSSRTVASTRSVLPVAWTAQARLAGEEVVVDLIARDARAWRGIGLELAFDTGVIDDVEVEAGDFLGGLTPERRIHGTLEMGAGAVVLLEHRTGAGTFSGTGSIARLRFRPLAGQSFTTIELRGGAVQTAAGIFALASERLRVRLVPSAFALQPNYPNPFNPETMIAYDLPYAAQVRLEVFDVLGQRVRLLAEGEQNAGRYRVAWDGRDDGAHAVASGLYFYRLQAADGFIAVRKMLLLR